MAERNIRAKVSEEELLTSFIQLIKNPVLAEEIFVDYLMHKRFSKDKTYRKINWEKLYFGNSEKVLQELHVTEENRKILIPIFLTERDIKTIKINVLETYIDSFLNFIKENIKNKKIEVRIVLDEEPPKEIKKLAEKYGIKIEVDPKRIEEVRKEMMEVLDKKRKRTEGMGHIRV